MIPIFKSEGIFLEPNLFIFIKWLGIFARSIPATVIYCNVKETVSVLDHGFVIMNVWVRQVPATTPFPPPPPFLYNPLQ